MCGSRAFFSNGSGGNSKAMVYLLLRCRELMWPAMRGSMFDAMRNGENRIGFRPLRLSLLSLATCVCNLWPFTGGRGGGLKHSTPCPRIRDHSTRPVAKPRGNCVEKRRLQALSVDRWQAMTFLGNVATAYATAMEPVPGPKP